MNRIVPSSIKASVPVKSRTSSGHRIEPEISPDEIAAIGAFLLLQNLESAGPYGRIGYVSLQENPPPSIDLDDINLDDGE